MSTTELKRPPRPGRRHAASWSCGTTPRSARTSTLSTTPGATRTRRPRRPTSRWRAPAAAPTSTIVLYRAAQDREDAAQDALAPRTFGSARPASARPLSRHAAGRAAVEPAEVVGQRLRRELVVREADALAARRRRRGRPSPSGPGSRSAAARRSPSRPARAAPACRAGTAPRPVIRRSLRNFFARASVSFAGSTETASIGTSPPCRPAPRGPGRPAPGTCPRRSSTRTSPRTAGRGTRQRDRLAVLIVQRERRRHRAGRPHEPRPAGRADGDARRPVVTARGDQDAGDRGGGAQRRASIRA